MAINTLGFVLHQVEEGNVGVYYRFGALLNVTTRPGIHAKLPWDQFDQVQITEQTDLVKNIPCGTSGGVTITFDRIEVVNQLREEAVLGTVRNYSVHYDKRMIYDKVHRCVEGEGWWHHNHNLCSLMTTPLPSLLAHARCSMINGFCSKNTLHDIFVEKFDIVDDELQIGLQQDCALRAPGINIIAVRVTKPVIPESIAQQYRLVEETKKSKLLADEEQKVVVVKAETRQRNANIEAQSKADVANIQIKQLLSEKRGQQDVWDIDTQMILTRQRAEADSAAYSTQQSAEANRELLTPEYLALRSVEALSGSTRTYFGPGIPSTFVDVGAAISAFKSGGVQGGGGGGEAGVAAAMLAAGTRPGTPGVSCGDKDKGTSCSAAPHVGK